MSDGKRAPRGSGAKPRQLPSGKWQASVTLGSDADGKQLRETQTFDTKTAAERWRRERAADVQHGNRQRTSRETAGEYLTRWLAGAAPGLEAGTLKGYRSHIDLHLIPSFGTVKLADLNRFHISKAYRAMEARGLKAATVHRAHSTLRRALNEAVDAGLIARNEATKVTLPKAARFRPHPLTEAEVRQFLAAVRSDRYHALYRTVLATGMRFGEFAALHWASVNLAAASLVVERSLERPKGGGVRLKETKSDRPRVIDLDARTVETLRGWQAHQAVEKRAMGAEWRGNGHVFTATNGAPLHESNLVKRLRRDLKRAGIERWDLRRLHDLRHTMATLMLGAGVPVKVVSERLGHASIHITLDTYQSLLPTLQQRAAGELGDMLGS